jgi:N-acetylneuraminic acid mutarotase
VGSVIYVLKGETEEGVTASVLKFNSAEGSWSEVAPMPVLRGGFVSCTYMSCIYVFGGFDERGGIRGSVFKFDTEANVWSRQASIPTGRSFYSSSLVDGLIYIVGAGNSGCEVLRFDPMTRVWITLASTSVSRRSSASFALANYLYAAGGGAASSTSASVERYDVATNTWIGVADMLEERRVFRAVCIDSADPAEEQDLFDSLIAKALTQRMYPAELI